MGHYYAFNLNLMCCILSESRSGHFFYASVLLIMMKVDVLGCPILRARDFGLLIFTYIL